MGIEHVYVVYDPTRPINRFDLGFRKVATAIELTHYEIFEPLKVTLVEIGDSESVPSEYSIFQPSSETNASTN